MASYEWPPQGGSSGGTVTSVGLSAPSSILSVSGSPVTTSGTLTLNLATQAANKVWAGPTTGADATPTFRSLVSGDIPSLSGIYLPLAGGTMAGNIAMGSHAITGFSFLSSSGSPIPASGAIRLSNNQQISWRNSLDSLNAVFDFGSTDVFDFIIGSTEAASVSTSGIQMQQQLQLNSASAVPVASNNIIIGGNAGDTLFISADHFTVPTSGHGGGIKFYGGTASPVNATEFYQGNTKSASIDTSGIWNFPLLTVSKPLILDGSGNLTSGNVSLTSQVTGLLPIANAGTGAATTSQNFAFIGPTSGSGAPSFRALTSGDIPSLSGIYLPLAGGAMSPGAITNLSGLASSASPLSATGFFKLGNNQLFGWRDQSNSFDVTLGYTSANVLEFTGTSSGNTNDFRSSHGSNTAGSDASLTAFVAGASGGDPKLALTVSGATDWSVGIDNSDSDKLKIGKSAAVGTNTYLTIDTSGNTTLAGSLALGSALTVANGGTGLGTLTLNNVILGNGTSTPQFVAPGTSGNVLTSNGTTWASTAPAASGVSTVGAFNASSIANGASISGSTITFGPADGTNPGMIKASGSQTLGATLTLTNTLAAQAKLKVGNPDATGNDAVVQASGAALTVTSQWLYGTGKDASTGVSFGSAATSSMACFKVNDLVVPGSLGTVPLLLHFSKSQSTVSGGTTITNEIDFRTFGKSTLSGGGVVTNYATLADNTAFTGDYFINSTSTNPSVLGGILSLPAGSQSVPSINFTNAATGFFKSATNEITVTNNNVLGVQFPASSTINIRLNRASGNKTQPTIVTVGSDSYGLFMTAAATVVGLTGSTTASLYGDSLGSEFTIGSTGAKLASNTAVGDYVFVGGGLKTVTAAVGNAADTTEDNLQSYTMGASDMFNNGSSLQIVAFGTYAANTDTKQVKLYFGSQVIADTGAIIANGGSWSIIADVIRTGTATQVISARVYNSNATILAAFDTYTAGTQTMSSTIVIKGTGQSGAATANNIIQKGLIVRCYPNAN